MKARRQERLAEAVKEEVSQIILHELRNPCLGFVTVLGADVSPDAKVAKIYVSVMGDPDVQEKTRQQLQAAKGFIQRSLASRLRMRHTPVLTFRLDQSVKKSIRVSQLIKQALSEDEALREGAVPPEPPESGRDQERS